MNREKTNDLPHYGLYIDGRWTEAASGATLPINEPALGTPMAYIANGGVEDVDRAVRAARAGPGDRQYDRAEAGLLHPAHGAHAGRDDSRDRTAAAGRGQFGHRPRRRGWRGDRAPPRRRQSRLYRLDRGWAPNYGACQRED